MDPQATLELIFTAMADNDRAAFNEAFDNLYNWLSRGGYPPICKSLGMAKVKTIDGYRKVPRQTISGPYAAIQTIRPDDFTAYEFVRYNHRGEVVARYPLRQA